MHEVIDRGAANVNLNVFWVDRFEFLFLPDFVVKMNVSHGQILYLI